MITAPRAVSTEAVARHYDEIDPFYRALWGDHLHHGLWEHPDATPEESVLALVDRVAEAARLGAGDRVCDIGCGYGATARRLAERFGARVTGLTVSPAQHRRAEEVAATAGAPEYLLRDWLRNELPDNAFDAAIAIESMSHMGDIPAAIREARRVLKPGGRLVMCVWLSAERPRPLETRWLLRPIAGEGRLAGLPTASDYRVWTEDAGLGGVEVEELSDRVRRTWSIIARRVALELRRPSAWRYLLDGRNTERVFPLTVLRILLAYRTGAMRYGIVSATKGDA